MKAKLARLTQERNDYHAQLKRRETDFENKHRAEHSATVVKMESELETKSDAARKSKEAASRSALEADGLRAQLAAERIKAEGVRVEYELAAEKKFNIAMGIKQRMIEARDTKLREASETANEIQGALDAADEVNTQRLATIRSICGRMGGPPRKPRTEEELEEELQTRKQLTRARNRDPKHIGDVIGVVGEDTEISVVVLTTAP